MAQTSTTPSGLGFDRAGPVGLPPVVLLHAGVADRRMWDPLWDDLTARRDAVRLDLRGFGDSKGTPDGAVDHVADVIETLDHLLIESCHLVGASFGAGVAVETALSRPAAVRSLLLCPPGGSLLAKLTPALRSFFDRENEALAADDLDAAVEANIETWVVGAGRTEADLDPGVPALVRDMQRRTFEIQQVWGDQSEVELDPPALDRLSELAARVLVLVGGRDLDTCHDAAARVVAGATQVHRVDWDGAAHLPSLERPREFLDLLLDWTGTD